MRGEVKETGGGRGEWGGREGRGEGGGRGGGRGGGERRDGGIKTTIQYSLPSIVMTTHNQSLLQKGNLLSRHSA